MIDTIRLIIAGSRDFNDYELLKKEVDVYLFGYILGNLNVDLTEEVLSIEIVSGGARGADRLGERYAKEHNLFIQQFLPDWSVGRGAGYLRNVEMGRYATHCICFDLGTNGTKHMIETAKKYKLGLKVVKVDSTNEKE